MSSKFAKRRSENRKRQTRSTPIKGAVVTTPLLKSIWQTMRESFYEIINN